jgi:hypothetical protein
MVYKDLFVVCIKCDNKILREQKEKIIVPFGKEYSLLIKNLNTRRSVVNITIDGSDVLGGTSLVINSNEDCNLEGFLRGNKVSNKFKFIEKTKEISDYRGNKAEDGLIRVSYRFEKEQHKYYSTNSSNQRNNTKDQIWENNDYCSSSSSSSSCGASCSFNSLSSHHEATMDISRSLDCIKNTDGITVKGSESNQKFNTIAPPILETEEHVIVIQLVGGEKEVYVKDKLKCETCGKKNKSNHKFCTNCGTSLI